MTRYPSLDDPQTLRESVRKKEPVVRIGDDDLQTLPLGDRGNFTAGGAQRIPLASQGEAPVPLSFGWALREDGESLEGTSARADRSMTQVPIERRGGRRWALARRETRC